VYTKQYPSPLFDLPFECYFIKCFISYREGEEITHSYFHSVNVLFKDKVPVVESINGWKTGGVNTKVYVNKKNER